MNKAEVAERLRAIARSVDAGAEVFTCNEVGNRVGWEQREAYESIFELKDVETDYPDTAAAPNALHIWNLPDRERNKLRAAMLDWAAAMAETGDLVVCSQ